MLYVFSECNSICGYYNLNFDCCINNLRIFRQNWFDHLVGIVHFDCCSFNYALCYVILFLLDYVVAPSCCSYFGRNLWNFPCLWYTTDYGQTVIRPELRRLHYWSSYTVCWHYDDFLRTPLVTWWTLKNYNILNYLMSIIFFRIFRWSASAPLWFDHCIDCIHLFHSFFTYSAARFAFLI